MSRRTRARIYDTLPALAPTMFGDLETVPGDAGDARRLSDAVAQRQVAEFIGSADFDGWTEALARVGNCSKPIRLVGSSQTVDTTTGEVVAEYSSADEPLGVTWVRCGDRRASECPSCARLYAADMFQLIRAGVIGGKTVPETVAENPLVFATLTAPSFGTVHGHRSDGRPCHPNPHRAGQCVHGRPRTCRARHPVDDPTSGHPLCADCYDYASQIVWQWWAPDLWRRFTIALRRLVAKSVGIPASRLGEVATVQYAKVAEYQVRGAVHFHALIRLDGPRTSDGFGAAGPAGIDPAALALLVEQAVRTVRMTVPGVDEHDPSRVLAFGQQVDARPVWASRRPDDPDRVLNPGQVAGYLAKYATKSADDTGSRETRDNPHHRRLRATARQLATRARQAQDQQAQQVPAATNDEGPYELLGKWVHMLGFRGHFASKSRRYSITLGALRRARRRAQALIAESRAAGRPLDLAALESDLLADDDTDTTLVIGHWSYAGTGWRTDAERVLATAAAARAREYDQWKAQQRRDADSRRQLSERTW